jgi:aromatic ring-opening dioxygenase catalytic subunit (LigB family)
MAHGVCRPTRSKKHPMSELPTIYLPHGAGPCFFMKWTMGPADTWDATATWLRGLAATLPEAPKALLVVSAHWESAAPTVITSPSPSLLFDYSGFPPETYQLTWPAPGAPEVAARVRALLDAAGIASAETAERGLDHGVFIPLKVAFPDAHIPTVQLSLVAGLDPAHHLAIGRALAPLRSEGVLIVASGMSYHNMRGLRGGAGAAGHAKAFDDWLGEVVALPEAERTSALGAWSAAPSARESHPREEHLLPLMVAAGAAGRAAGRVVFRDEVMGVVVSAHQFG